jgi:hypothetical protein
LGWTMVWAQAVDAVEVLRYNGRVSGKGCGQVLRPLKYFQSVVRLCSFSQAIEVLYIIRTKYPTKLA